MTDELTRQIACVEREIKMRERVYPRWVADKRMSQAKADDELATMRAVLVRLREGTDYAAGYAAGQRDRDSLRALLRQVRHHAPLPRGLEDAIDSALGEGE